MLMVPSNPRKGKEEPNSFQSDTTALTVTYSSATENSRKTQKRNNTDNNIINDKN